MAIDLSRIDINTPPEEQEIKILLVVENQDRYESTAAFLTKRGWPTVVKNSVEGAILHYTQQSPHFVVVSLSHKSKKISKLPTILAQTFNANCIVFLERNDSLGIKRMNSSSIRNKMHENVSGPSLSRKIKKLIQDTQDYEKEVDKKLLSERNAIGDDVINISGDKQDSNYRVSGNADGPDTYRFSQDKKYSELSAAEKLKQLQEQLGGPESNDDGDRSGIGYMPDQSSDPSGYGMSNHNRGLGIESDSKGPQKGSLSQNESSVDSKETDLDSGLEMFGSIDGNQNADGQLNRDEGLADGKEYLSKDQSSTASLDSKGRDSLDSSNNETDATLANRENHQPNLWTKETGDKKSHLPDLQNQKDGKKENHKPSDDSTSVKSKENDLPSAQLENEKGRENHLAGQEEQNLNENELKELLDDIENNREQGNRNQEKVAKKNQMDGMKNSLSNAPKFPWEKRNVQRTSSEKKPTTLEKNKNVTNINQLKDVDIPPGLKPLQRALNQSLNKSVAKNQSITSQLNDKYYVECVGVRSEVANGYLLVISPEEGPLLNDFLLDFRSSLIQEIGFQNTRMNIDTSERLTLPPVEDILSFVDKEATISFFRDHKHIEVCVAFFETDMIYEEKNITEKGMTPVKVQNVAVEKPVDFNTFLHFKKNDKFYLYIKKSRHLMKKQKEKLVDKKVEYLHVNSKDLNLLKKFIAEGFFEEKIASYKEDKLKKAS